MPSALGLPPVTLRAIRECRRDSSEVVDWEEQEPSRAAVLGQRVRRVRSFLREVAMLGHVGSHVVSAMVSMNC